MAHFSSIVNIKLIKADSDLGKFAKIIAFHNNNPHDFNNAYKIR